MEKETLYQVQRKSKISDCWETMYSWTRSELAADSLEKAKKMWKDNKFRVIAITTITTDVTRRMNRTLKLRGAS